MNTDFAAYMREMGQKRKISDKEEDGREELQSSVPGSLTMPEPVWVDEKKFLARVQQVRIFC
jgi:hypothetical protein